MAGRIKTCSESPAVYNSSTSYTFNSSIDQALDIWQKQSFVILSQVHQRKFLESCEWRKNTLMPILKIRSAKIESQDHYPKNAQVQAEKVEKLFGDINEINLPEALYLLRQTMLGMEALTEKYGRIDIDQVDCGVNAYGKCKIWISDETVVMKKQKVSSSTPSQLLLSVFTLIFGMIKTCYRRFLKSLYLEISENHENITFSQIHRKMEMYIKERKINLPKSLNKMSANLQKISLKSLQSYIIRSSLSKRKKKNMLSPKNTTQTSPASKKNSSAKESIRDSNGLQKNLTKNLQTYSLTNLISVENKKETRDRTSPLGSNDSRHSMELVHSYPIKVSGSIYRNKKSDATTHITDTVNGSTDIPFQKLTTYRQTSSILMENQKQPKVNLNLGSLDPVPEYSVQNSNSGEGKMSQSLISYSQEERDEVHDIKASSASEGFENFWEKKFINLFDQNVKELKQSVHCGGEERKASNLEVELQMLGKFGRKICGSICPVDDRS